MVSQRGILNLYHSDGQRDAYVRRGNAMRLHGIDSELVDQAGVRKMLPFLDFANARFPIQGGLLQRRGGTVRHDAVAWGYARAADRRGVDIIQNCEVTAIRRDGNRVTGIDTSRGFIGAKKIGMAVAGNTSRVGDMAGLRLPIAGSIDHQTCRVHSYKAWMHRSHRFRKRPSGGKKAARSFHPRRRRGL